MAVHGANIKIDDLVHRFGARKLLTFEGISAEVQPGEALAIIGRSGCGKTTLLHIIAGLLRPTGGTIHIDGKLVQGPSPRWIMMFQQPSLYPWMRVSQNVGIGLRFAHRRKAEIRERVDVALRLVELENCAEANVQDLSGGQQQRVALARSLVMEPELLLLDEPFSALDAFTRAALQRDVRSIAKRLGLTLVIVTHNIDEAVLMADRTLVMAGSPGRIVRCLPIILSDPRDQKNPDVQAVRDRLMKCFEAAAANHDPGVASEKCGDDVDPEGGSSTEFDLKIMADSFDVTQPRLDLPTKGD